MKKLILTIILLPFVLASQTYETDVAEILGIVLDPDVRPTSSYKDQVIG